MAKPAQISKFCIIKNRPLQDLRKTLSVLETFIAYSANKRAQKRPHHLTRVAFSCVALHSENFEPNFVQSSKSYTYVLNLDSTIHPKLRMAWVSKDAKFKSVWLMCCCSIWFEQTRFFSQKSTKNRLFVKGFSAFFKFGWITTESSRMGCCSILKPVSEKLWYINIKCPLHKHSLVRY